MCEFHQVFQIRSLGNPSILHFQKDYRCFFVFTIHYHLKVKDSSHADTNILRVSRQSFKSTRNFVSPLIYFPISYLYLLKRLWPRDRQQIKKYIYNLITVSWIQLTKFDLRQENVGKYS